MVFTLAIHLYVEEDKGVEESTRAELTDASNIYVNDPETISLIVMQDQADASKWNLS